MKHIETEIIISAKPERVWEILTDFEHQPDWNPFIRSISGKKKVGEQLTVFLQPPGGDGMTFKPTVLSFDENKEFRWKGKLWVKGIFDGEHHFSLIDLDNGTTKFVHSEQFSGILVALLGSLLKNTKEGFEQMNEALKAKCENE